MFGNYEEISASMVAGTATIEKAVMEMPRPIPLSEERIVITLDRWNPNTGEKVDPVVQQIYKRDLLNDKANLEKQIENLKARVASIDELLSRFEETKL